MKKILLIRPPSSYNDNLRGFQLDFPVGLLYIAAVLEKNGYTPEIFDCRLNFSNPELLNTYKNRKYVNDNWENELKKVIKTKNPDIVGISNQFSAQMDNAVKVANAVKSVSKKIVTVVGGPHATVSKKLFFELTDSIDIVVLGEGEYTFLKIVDFINIDKPVTDIPGIFYKTNSGKIVVTETNCPIMDLDELPFPAYHLLDIEKYFKAKQLGFEIRGRYNYPGSERSIPMITSRGCPYNCIFCSIHLHMGRKWRYHSSEYVLNHIKYVIKKYKIRHIHFEDDSINISKPRFTEIVDGISTLNSGVTWDTPNGLRADTLDLNILKKIKKSKCTYLIIGVESGDQEVLNKIVHKRLDLKKVVIAAKLCKQLGIDLRAFYIYGFPGETIRNIRNTMNFALVLLEKYGVYPYIHMAMPYLGTELYEICRKNKYISIEYDAEIAKLLISGTPLIQTKEFTILDIERLHSEFHKKLRNLTIRNYLTLLEQNKKFLDEVLISTKNQYEIAEDKIREIVEYQNCKQRSDLLK